MLQETALRASRLNGICPPLILCNEEHRFLAAEQLREAGLPSRRIILEPQGRNTAPALAIAALELALNGSINSVSADVGEGSAHEQELMLVLPADHLIQNEANFAIAVETGAIEAKRGAMVAFGIVPNKPETGYGYIECGQQVKASDCFNIAQFIEKPVRGRAIEFVNSGRFLWNSGMFLMSPQRYLDELLLYSPDVLAAAKESWARRKEEEYFIRLDPTSFNSCPSISIDYAVMEKTKSAIVVPADMGWSDVGSWEALWEASAKDNEGNRALGDVNIRDTQNSYIRSENRFLSVIGLNEVVVVETRDAVLVSSMSKVQSVKEVVLTLSRAGRSEHLNHQRVYRPWGYYESIDSSTGFQVKRLMVEPGEAISLQLHYRRAEHWIVVSGTARVTRGDEPMTLSRNESTYIPVGMKHRLENPGKERLYIIEVQSGDYLGEDDIVRFEDRYNRI
jgi:mannose-1-phosphate guanylyltransferase/mannose-6-phosphate isomerase